MAKKVGIFSGTFDPIHDGHVEFVKKAIKQCKLDKVFFMVERHPRRKQGVKAFEHRQMMVQLAIRDEQKLGSIILEQTRFTPQETLPVLEARFEGAKLVLIMGDDMLTHLNEWPHVTDLIKRVRFIIGVRGSREKAIEHIKTLEKTRGLKFSYDMFSSSLKTVSSSTVRKQLRNGTTPPLNPKVQAYINEVGLYVSDDSEEK